MTVDVDRFAAYLVACVVVLMIPGPTILLVVSRSLNHGARVRRATVAGVVLGDLVAMTAAMLGAGAVLLASAGLFAALRVAGGVYLLLLGIRTWRSRGQQWITGDTADTSPRRVFTESFAVTATNPKSIAFFVAFVPQFINPALPWLPQTLVMIMAFVILGGLNALAYAWLAGRARGIMLEPATRRRVARVSGGALVAGGAAVIVTTHG
jgi:threonine/homoserine/homoserine lactone efflux protein